MKKLFALIALSLLLAGCLHEPAAKPTPAPLQVPTIDASAIPTATPTATPTPTPTPSSTPSPTPTPAPEYAEMSAQQFIANCAAKAVVPGALRSALPVSESGLLYDKYAIYDSRDYIPLEGFPPAQKPSSLDATGSTNYKFYGAPIPKPTSDHRCWMQIEKIE